MICLYGYAEITITVRALKEGFSLECKDTVCQCFTGKVNHQHVKTISFSPAWR